MAETWITRLASDFFGSLGADAFMSVLKKFMEQTGEEVSKRAGEWISLRIFGPKTEDERRYNEARQAMDGADRTRLNKKLDELDSDRSDYFRLTVMNDDIAKITANLVMYAQMSDADWQREKKIMNLQQQAAQSLFEGFIDWAGKSWDAFVATIKQARTNINQDVDATGLPAALTDLNQKFLNRIKTQLS